MPIVMTGSPGGAIGGNAGSAFGSGLSGLTTSPKKMFSPGLEVWVRRGEEDQKMQKERRAMYDELKSTKIAEATRQQKAQDAAKAKAKDAFAERRAKELAAEEEEKKRVAKWRKDCLKQNRKEFAMDGEPGYGPTRWCWPTAHHHPRHCNGTGGAGVSENDVLLTSPLLLPGGITVGPDKDHKNDLLLIHSKRVFSPQPGEAELLKITDALGGTLDDMKERDAKMRAMRVQAENEAAELDRLEREAEAKKRQSEILQKQATAKAAELRARQIKKEMAEETAKQAKAKAAAEKVRYERSQTERAEMVKHLKMDMKLRDEDEIANERREGSSMSKGSKADFVSAAKTKGNDDMVDF